MSFHNWLNQVTEHYRALPRDEQITTVQTLITASSPSNLFYLHRDLSFLLKRDFLGRLPRELAEKLLFYLDVRTLHVCCQVLLRPATVNLKMSGGVLVSLNSLMEPNR